MRYLNSALLAVIALLLAYQAYPQASRDFPILAGCTKESDDSYTLEQVKCLQRVYRH